MVNCMVSVDIVRHSAENLHSFLLVEGIRAEVIDRGIDWNMGNENEQ